MFPDSFIRYPAILKDVTLQLANQFTINEMILFEYWFWKCISFRKWITHYKQEEIIEKYIKSISTFKRSKKSLIDKNIISIIDVNSDVKKKYRIYKGKVVIFNPFFDTWSMDLSELDISKYNITDNQLVKNLEFLNP